MTEARTDTPRGRAPRGPLKRSSLENAALHYLERYASSVEGLRRVLARRVERAAREERCDREEAMTWVDDIVARFARSGMVDDRVFAEAKVASRRRRGDSARRIRMTLREKGVDPAVIDDALAAEAGDGEADVEADAELTAAWRLAQRRRLGPYRPAGAREAVRLRDLAVLARAGFDRATAIAVIDAAAPPG